MADGRLKSPTSQQAEDTSARSGVGVFDPLQAGLITPSLPTRGYPDRTFVDPLSTFASPDPFSTPPPSSSGSTTPAAGYPSPQTLAQLYPPPPGPPPPIRQPYTLPLQPYPPPPPPPITTTSGPPTHQHSSSIPLSSTPSMIQHQQGQRAIIDPLLQPIPPQASPLPPSSANRPREPSVPELVDSFLASTSGVVPQPDQFKTRRGLASLARMRAWRTVLEVAEAVIKGEVDESEYHTGDADHFDVVIFTFLALRKLRRTKELETMVQNLEPNAPLPMLFLAADSLTSLGKPKEACTALLRLKAMLEARRDELESQATSTSRDGKDASIKHQAVEDLQRDDLPTTVEDIVWWLGKINMAMTTALLADKSWRSALVLLETFRKEIEASLRGDGQGPARDAALQAKAEILTRIARVFLQMGNVEEARRFFGLAELASSEMPSGSSMYGLAMSKVAMGKALLAFADSTSADALAELEKVLEVEKRRQETELRATPFSATQGDGGRDVVRPWVNLLAVASEESLLAAAVNNLAVALLYVGDVSRAMSLLEDFIAEDPPRHMTACAVANLSLLYELTADKLARDRKMKVLQGVAHRFRLDDIDARFWPAPQPSL